MHNILQKVVHFCMVQRIYIVIILLKLTDVINTEYILLYYIYYIIIIDNIDYEDTLYLSLK